MSAAAPAVAASAPAGLPSVLDALDEILLQVASDGRVLAWKAAAWRPLGLDGGVTAARIDPAVAGAGLETLLARVRLQGRLTRDGQWATGSGGRVGVRVAVDLEEGAAVARLVCAATRLPSEAEHPSLRRHAPYREFFECSLVPARVRDAEYRVVVINEADCQLVGCSVQELVGRDPIFEVPPDCRAEALRVRSETRPRLSRVIEQRQRLLSGEQLPASMTWRVVRTDGSIRVRRLLRNASRDRRGPRIDVIAHHD